MLKYCLAMAALSFGWLVSACTPPKAEEPEPPVEEVIQETIVEATQERNEDPTEPPKQATDAPKVAEAPNPNVNPNSSPGWGGPAAGGANPRTRRGENNDASPAVDDERLGAALQWLADHQNPNGHWSADTYHNDSIRSAKGAKITRNVDFRDHLEKTRGSADHDTGKAAYSVGVTALAVIAFVGDGHTHKDGKFARNVSRGIRYLMSVQDIEGCFGPRDGDEFVYNHAVCAMTIAELYEMTLAPNFKSRAQKAVDFIVRCQNPGSGWGYGVQAKEPNSFITALMTLALKSATLAGLEFDDEVVYKGANTWFDRAYGKDENAYDRTWYDLAGTRSHYAGTAASKYDANPAMDACSIMTRLFTNHTEATDRKLAQQVQLILRALPVWYAENDEAAGPWKIDMYYWYFGSLALFQLGGSSWNAWEAKLIHPALLKHQRGYHAKDRAASPGVIAPSHLPNGEQNPDAGRWKLDEHGSWDPVDAWSERGGRVYSTAINAMTLEVFHRYRRAAKK